MKEKIQIIWFKKNLRTQDNAILANINPDIPTIWVYFFEPHIMGLPDYSDFHLKFIIESLEYLKTQLETYNIPLLYLPYDAVAGFTHLSTHYEIDSVHSHEETGNWETYMRDKQVIKWSKKEYIELKEYPTNWVVRRLKSRDDWSKIWKQRMSEDIYIPQKVSAIVQISEKIKTLSHETIRKQKKKIEHLKTIQKWWEDAWLQVLESFLSKRSSSYMYDIGKPFESQSSCSRLSPYITYWCISIKQVFHASLIRMQELKDIWTPTAKKHRKSISLFLARLHWQSHFIQKLEDEPEMEWKNLNPKFDSIRQDINHELIDKVFAARTGIPYIDATITQLQQYGWCNFRSRAVLVSFLCNTCMQPWQAVAHRVAQLFTDYEPGIHYPQFQMQAGTTGINTIRIYNPVYNWEKKDPEWKFIRTFLPELKSVPNKFIHKPHEWEWFENLDYPKPIVDIKANNSIARDTLWKIKWNTPKNIKKKIVKKHASRKKLDRTRKQKKKEVENQTALF